MQVELDGTRGFFANNCHDIITVSINSPILSLCIVQWHSASTPLEMFCLEGAGLKGLSGTTVSVEPTRSMAKEDPALYKSIDCLLLTRQHNSRLGCHSIGSKCFVCSKYTGQLTHMRES